MGVFGAKDIVGVDRSWVNRFATLTDTSWVDSLVPKVDTSWVNRFATLTDTSWVNRFATLTDTSWADSLVPKVDASWVNRFATLTDTSWVNRFATLTDISWVDSLVPKVDVSWVNRFATLTDTSWVDSLVPKVDTSWVNRFATLLPTIDQSWFEHLADLVNSRVRGLPTNWGEISTKHVLDEEKLRSIILVEGIPLAWVPGPDLLERLLVAEHASERRELIRNGWRGILRDCVSVCQELPSRQGRSHARFVEMSARAMRDGHYEAAQALSANLVDTLGRRYVKPHAVGYDWSLVTAKNQRPKLSKLTMRALMVLGPLAVGHAGYHPEDLVPRAFSRHATAHGVSPRQYTKTNSLIALMNAVALLCWLERDSDAFVDTAATSR